MCGITGIFAFNLVGKFNLVNVTAATQALSKRGPDNQDIYHDEFVGLGHRRLSIIDTSAVAHQPMWDETKRYCIVYNGEIFNFLELKKNPHSRFKHISCWHLHRAATRQRRRRHLVPPSSTTSVLQLMAK